MYNLLQRRQRRAEPRPRKNMMPIGHEVSEIIKYTCKKTDEHNNVTKNIRSHFTECSVNVYMPRCTTNKPLKAAAQCRRPLRGTRTRQPNSCTTGSRSLTTHDHIRHPTVHTSFENLHKLLRLSNPKRTLRR